MSRTNPADDASAGFLHTSGASATASPVIPPQRTAALASIIADVTGTPAPRVSSALQPLLPVIASLELLQAHMSAWDGLIHRRLRCTPLSLEGDAAASFRPVTLTSAFRSGWEIITAEVCYREPGVMITHHLARPCEDRTTIEDGPSVSFRLGNTPMGTPWEPDRSALGGDGDCDDVAWLLRPEHLKRWAQASGDSNAIHLDPQAAARALPGTDVAGGPVVVAHGTLLAALCLAAQNSTVQLPTVQNQTGQLPAVQNHSAQGQTAHREKPLGSTQESLVGVAATRQQSWGCRFLHACRVPSQGVRVRWDSQLGELRNNAQVLVRFL